MKFSVFLQLQLKRLWKNRVFIALLILFPICLFLLSQSFQKEEDSRIPVGIYFSAEDTLTETLCKKLLSLDDSLFVFSQAASEEDLIRGVQNNSFECGYLFAKPLQAELDKSHLKNLITVYVSETTTCTGIVNELVYANLFEEYSLSLLQETLADAGHLPFHKEEDAESSLPPVTKEKIEQAYREHLNDGSTFRIDVQFVTDSEPAPVTGTTVATLPLLRGLTSVFLLLCGFLALLTVYHDNKNGFYTRLYGNLRIICPLLTMGTYLLPAGLICLLGLSLAGCVSSVGTELLALGIYLLALFLFYSVLGALIRNHTVLCAAFPMILLCTLIFTPVIVDLSAFFPWIKAVRLALPTYYYLLFF